MNSPRPNRRKLYFEIEPKADTIANTISNAISDIRNLSVFWDFDVPSSWWVHHKECMHCRKRQLYEYNKFISGEWVWNRRYCIRHYLADHLDSLALDHTDNIVSNRYIEFTASKEQIVFKLKTNNYDYDVAINRQKAELLCIYKGKKYAFTYRNHTNALPYASTYLLLIGAVNNIIYQVQLALEDVANAKNKNTCRAYNIYINGILAVPACEESEAEGE